MASLVAVMFVVAYSTFDWGSVKPATLKRMPRSETAVMVVTVVLTVATGNLSIGVLAGVIVAALLFARRVEVDRLPDPDGTNCLYVVHGEVFFASEQELIDAFDYAEDPPHVLIDFSRAHLWDASAIAALDTIEAQYGKHGIEIAISGLDEPSGGAARTAVRAAHPGPLTQVPLTGPTFGTTCSMFTAITAITPFPKPQSFVCNAESVTYACDRCRGDDATSVRKLICFK